ncbi:MAG: mycofactocin biosynthesis chaperone MftB, partial [Solirubrobacteraceae bacterium]
MSDATQLSPDVAPATPVPVLEDAWALSPSVALRAEPFGAMAYDFSTRRLSFLKHPKLADVVRSLGRHPRALDACREAGIGERELPVVEAGLRRLAETGMLVPRHERRRPRDAATLCSPSVAAGGTRT